MSEPIRAWWNQPLFLARSGRYSSAVVRAVHSNICIQFLLLVLSGFVLDAGLMLQVVGLAMMAWWTAAIPILVRRPQTCRRGELIFLRIGFCAFIPLSLFGAPLWGWLRSPV